MTPLALTNFTAFYLAQILVSGYAVSRGGAPERFAGAALLAAAILSTTAQHLIGFSFAEVAPALVGIDLLLLLFLIMLAVVADRFWPLWLAGCQVILIASHGVRSYDPSVLPFAYWLIISKLAYPMLLIVFLGVRRHQARGPEPAWTFDRKRRESATSTNDDPAIAGHKSGSNTGRRARF